MMKDPFFPISRLDIPVEVQIELTEYCNNRCLFCYNRSNTHPGSRNRVDIEKYRSLLSSLLEAGVRTVIFTGGEPTLCDDLPELCGHCHSIKLRCSILSNARAITPWFLDAVGDTTIQVSLHGSDEQTHDALVGVPGAFRQTMQSLDVLSRRGHPFSVNMVVSKKNFTQVDEVIDILCAHGLSEFSVSRMDLIGSARGIPHLELDRKEINTLFEKLHSLAIGRKLKPHFISPIPYCCIDDLENHFKYIPSCSGGLTWCSITPSGEVRFCSSSQVSLGNAFNKKINELWGSTEGHRRYRAGHYLPGVCSECPFIASCKGGCRAIVDENGLSDRLDPLADPERIPALKAFAEKREKHTREIQESLRRQIRKEYSAVVFAAKPFSVRRHEGSWFVVFDDTTCSAMSVVALDILQWASGGKSFGEIFRNFKAEYPKACMNTAKAEQFILDTLGHFASQGYILVRRCENMADAAAAVPEAAH